MLRCGRIRAQITFLQILTDHWWKGRIASVSKWRVQKWEHIFRIHLLKVTSTCKAGVHPRNWGSCHATPHRLHSPWECSLCSQLLHRLPQHSKLLLCVCDLDLFRLFLKENCNGQVSITDITPMKNTTSCNFPPCGYTNLKMWVKHSLRYNNQKANKKDLKSPDFRFIAAVIVPGWGWQLSQCCPWLSQDKDRNTSNSSPRCEKKTLFTAWAVIWLAAQLQPAPKDSSAAKLLFTLFLLLQKVSFL